MPQQQKINAYSVSVVVPTCNRKTALLTLLASLDKSDYPLLEVVIVDASDIPLFPSEYEAFSHLSIYYIRSERSVCVQRNRGIGAAQGPLIFLCDDDMEVPSHYIRHLVTHMTAYPAAGAVSGLVLQEEKGEWQASYPVRSAAELVRKFIFQHGIWGEIKCRDHFLLKGIKRYYQRKGNHISRAGWPVITQFSGNYVVTPVYTLGASLVKKQWLESSPYEEVLDRHGIGDNYGVAMGFPPNGMHLLPHAVVYHHRESAHRLHHSVGYFRRVLALDYFIQTKVALKHVRKRWLLWSLTGNLFMTLMGRDRSMFRATLKTIRLVAFGNNPYLQAARKGQRITEPVV